MLFESTETFCYVYVYVYYKFGNRNKWNAVATKSRGFIDYERSRFSW